MAVNVWDVIRDPRTAEMRLADEEVDAELPDEQNAIERMRQEIIALVDLWQAERTRNHNARADSCPACTAAWRYATRSAIVAVVTPSAPVKPVVMPAAPDNSAPSAEAVQALTESRLQRALAIVAARVERLTHDEQRGRLTAAQRRRLRRFRVELGALQRLVL